MQVLGVDPGTIRTGYGVVSLDNGVVKHIYSGIINLTKVTYMPEKLHIINEKLNQIIADYRPDEFSIETAFYGKNIQSALKIGLARGAAILSAYNNNLGIGEYSPREVKKSIVGTGAASKEQVNYMIKSILNINEKEIALDESDALAVAICHAFRIKGFFKKSTNWKSFIEQFPERIIE